MFSGGAEVQVQRSRCRGQGAEVQQRPRCRCRGNEVLNGCGGSAEVVMQVIVQVQSRCRSGTGRWRRWRGAEIKRC